MESVYSFGDWGITKTSSMFPQQCLYNIADFKTSHTDDNFNATISGGSKAISIITLKLNTRNEIYNPSIEIFPPPINFSDVSSNKKIIGILYFTTYQIKLNVRSNSELASVTHLLGEGVITNILFVFYWYYNIICMFILLYSVCC